MSRPPKGEDGSKMRDATRYRVRVTPKEDELIHKLMDKMDLLTPGDLFREGIREIGKREGLLQT